jgi:hypothetical protein
VSAPAEPPLSGYLVIAAALEALSAWSDDQVASGHSTKWVCYQVTATARHVARLARQADRGEPVDPPFLSLPDAP